MVRVTGSADEFGAKCSEACVCSAWTAEIPKSDCDDTNDLDLRLGSGDTSRVSGRCGHGRQADATLVYHQYGFVQTIKPADRVVEDICHSLYATPTMGRRVWLGELVAFSLPKFFSTSSPVGGLVVHDQKQAERVRALRDAEPRRSIQQQDEKSSIFCDLTTRSHFEFVRLYLSRLVNAQITDRELGGLPKNVSEISARGQRRKEIMAIYCDAVGGHACPPGWHAMMLERLPYFFPVSGDEARLLDARSCLREIGVEADMYSIDIARNMGSPRFVRMLLLPCHDAIPSEIFSEILSILKSLGACRSAI